MRGGEAVVAAGQEAAGPHQREGQPDADRDPIEERRQRLACAVQIERGGADREQQPAVSGAARMQDRPPRGRGHRRRHRPQRLEQVAADQRPDVGGGDRVRRVPARGAVARREVERQRRADQRGDRRELEVVGRQPGRKTVARQPGDEQRPHRRRPIRNPSGASTQTIVAARGRSRPGETRQSPPSSGGVLQASAEPSSVPLHECRSRRRSAARSSLVSQLSLDAAQLSEPAEQASQKLGPFAAAVAVAAAVAGEGSRVEADTADVARRDGRRRTMRRSAAGDSATLAAPDAVRRRPCRRPVLPPSAHRRRHTFERAPAPPTRRRSRRSSRRWRRRRPASRRRARGAARPDASREPRSRAPAAPSNARASSAAVVVATAPSSGGNGVWALGAHGDRARNAAADRPDDQRVGGPAHAGLVQRRDLGCWGRAIGDRVGGGVIRGGGLEPRRQSLPRRIVERRDDLRIGAQRVPQRKLVERRRPVTAPDQAPASTTQATTNQRALPHRLSL